MMMTKKRHLARKDYKYFHSEIKRLGSFLRSISPVGFGGVSLYNALRFFYVGLCKGSFNTRASSIAFNFLLAIGPAALFFISLLPYFPVSNLKEELLIVLNKIMPSDSYIAIGPLLNEIFGRHAGLSFFGLLVSLFFAQKGIHGIIEAFNASYHNIKARSWYNQRLIAIALVFIFYALFIMAFLLLFLSRSLLERFVEHGFIEKKLFYYMLIGGKWFTVILLTFFGISFLYQLAPGNRNRFKFFSAGSLTATLLSILASFGFSFFVNNFAHFNQFFGSVGALIALMLWVNFNSLTLLIGFELDASINDAQQFSIKP